MSTLASALQLRTRARIAPEKPTYEEIRYFLRQLLER